MKHSLAALAATALLLPACGMSPEEREVLLERTVTIRSAALSAAADVEFVPWVRVTARGGVELLSLRVRVFDDANGDGVMQPEEFGGISRVREAESPGTELLSISKLSFPASLARPALLCEADTDEGLHTRVIVLR